MGQGPLKHEVLVPLGPEYQPHRPSKCGTKGSHSSDPGRWVGSSCGGPRWGGRPVRGTDMRVPHTVIVARVPAHTCMHTVIHTCACAPHQHILTSYTGRPSPWATHMSIHTGLPTADPQGHKQTPEIDSHTHLHLWIQECGVGILFVTWGGLTHTPDIPSSPSPIPHPHSSHIHMDSHSQPGHTWHTAGKAQTGKGDN